MSAGQLALEETAKRFADMTAAEAELGFSDKFCDYREPLIQVAIFKKAEEDALITFDGKTSKEIIEEAKAKFHKKTRRKLIMEGKEIPPIIEEASKGDTINLPEMTIEDDITLKDGVTLMGVSTPASSEPRDGETVISGEIIPETTLNVSGLTLTGNAFDNDFKDVEDTNLDNNRILKMSSN